MGIVIIMGLFAGIGIKQEFSSSSGLSGRGKLAHRPMFFCRNARRRIAEPDLPNHSA
jgi:hypothetical protein